MKLVATFTETDTVGLDVAWDFVNNPNDDAENEDIWNIHASVNGGYPFLSWQPTGDISSPQITILSPINKTSFSGNQT